MNAPYHDALIGEQLAQLHRRIEVEGWPGVTVARDGDLIYVGLPGRPATARYLARIDTARYPVEPYWIGFLDPALAPEDRPRASDADPRQWPMSGVPGLEGSFHVAFQGPYRAFWCRECTVQFFHYHPDIVWDPAAWPLDVVVANLREAVIHAHHPSRWRPLHQPLLRAAAQQRNLQLPDAAGIGNA